MRRTCSINRRVPLVFAAIFAATLLLYAASFRHWSLYQTDYDYAGALSSENCHVQISRGRFIISRMSLVSSYLSWPSDPSWRNAGGFSYDRRLFSNGKLMAEHIAAPLYPLPVFAGLLFAWQMRRRPAQTSGRCINCGYDLRATPEQCPECGQSAVPAAE